MDTLPYRQRRVVRCILMAFTALSANTLYAADTDTVELEAVTVVGKRAEQPQQNLTTVTKTADTIRKEQVNNIRDLTRYDPGIAVNEQGQGASSGYSIRGVDRNRVSILVDGIAQGQVFSPGGLQGAQGDFGGTINEIEYENIKEVSIEKGTNSVAGGSGAMGGTVLFATKDASDVIKPGQNWGADYKNSFSSKDGRRVNSLAVAGRLGGLEGLAQFTHRTGHEIEAHPDTAPQTLTYFYHPKHCTAGGRYCEYTTTYAAKDVWGPTREVPNPMDYRTRSWLLRGGYHFNNEHYSGLIFEDTRQEYNTQDMTYPVFVTDPKQVNLDSTTGSRYTNFSTLLQDNRHQKRRIGWEYRYTAAEAGKWSPDSVKVSIDKQQVNMANHHRRQRCAEHLGRCEPTEIDQWMANNQTATHDTNKRLHISADKAFDWGSSHHRVNLSAGIDRSRFQPRESYDRKYLHKLCPFDYNRQEYICRTIVEEEHDTNTKLHPIDGKSHFAALTDTIDLGKYFTLPLGVRHDYYSYRSANRFVGNSSYRHTSWNAGLSFKPNRHIELAYKASNGFRVPSALELYSTEMLYANPNGVEPTDTKLKPETAFNQELGLAVRGRVGNARINAFRADYRDLLGELIPPRTDGNGLENARIANIQNAHTWGWDIRLQGDLHELASWLPEGLSTSLAYSIVKPRKTPDKLDGNQTNFVNSNYHMDTLQPARLVWALDYDAPSGKWGVGSRVVHSMPKKAEENQHMLWHPARNETVSRQYIPQLSKRWTTLDLSGWYRWGKHTTLRGGVYNVFNRKYTQWESLRQLGIHGQSTGGITNVSGSGIRRLSAPGRNFAFTLEMKF